MTTTTARSSADPGPAPAGAGPTAAVGYGLAAVPATEGTNTHAQGAGGSGGTGVPHPEFGRLEDWLSEYFLPMFRRTLGGEYRWCSQWWRHGEAISRLTALWHAWEVLRTQPGTGIATWYREHLDHQLPILLGARGPFYQCSETIHREPHQAAAQPAPDGWWEPGEPGPGEAHSTVISDPHDRHDGDSDGGEVEATTDGRT
jgi:Domain of unknown function (DUF4913)